MKLSEFKVGDKVRDLNWRKGYWFEILYMGRMAAFGREPGDAEGHYFFDSQSEWEPYEESKKKVTKWLWASIHGEISGIMSDTASHGQPIKLEWSATEFEE